MGTVILTHIGKKPYPAVAYPDFGNRGKKYLVYYELYHLKNGTEDEIQFFDAQFKAARYRRFVKNIYINKKENKEKALQVQISYLLELPSTKKEDTMLIFQRQSNWQTDVFNIKTLDSLVINLNDIEP